MSDKIKTPEEKAKEIGFVSFFQSQDYANPRFNPVRDYQEVESGLAVDLNDALKTGVIPSASSPLDSNGIDDPENVIGVMRDKFDIIDAQRAVRKYGKNAKIESSLAQQPAQQPSE